MKREYNLYKLGLGSDLGVRMIRTIAAKTEEEAKAIYSQLLAIQKVRRPDETVDRVIYL